jgi:hypothetical protein
MLEIFDSVQGEEKGESIDLRDGNSMEWEEKRR